MGKQYNTRDMHALESVFTDERVGLPIYFELYRKYAGFADESLTASLGAYISFREITERFQNNPVGALEWLAKGIGEGCLTQKNCISSCRLTRKGCSILKRHFPELSKLELAKVEKG